MTFHVPEQFRILRGTLATDSSYGNNGAFIIPSPNPLSSIILRVIASDTNELPPEAGEKWEHVSVSTHSRNPTWDEMCYVKGLFWDEEDCVLQFHPPASDYVNNHPFCLHLWRPINLPIPRPPSWMVGYKSPGVIV